MRSSCLYCLGIDNHLTICCHDNSNMLNCVWCMYVDCLWTVFVFPVCLRYVMSEVSLRVLLGD